MDFDEVIPNLPDYPVVARREVGFTKYEPEKMPMRAYRMAMLGLTEEDIAIALGISENTMLEWKHLYPEFEDAIFKGKEVADSEVAISLYKRATGYSHPDVEIRVVNGEVIQIPVTKHYPPDTTAAIFWLKNRQRRAWRDVWNIEHTGKDGKEMKEVHQIIATMDLKQLSSEELEVVAALGIKVNKAKELTNNGSNQEKETIDV